MYCPNCGTELRESNQRFCSSCGSKISSSDEKIELEPQEKQYTTPVLQPSKQTYSEVSISPQKVPIKGAIGPYSKRSLADGIISIGITVVALYCSLIVFIVTRTGLPYPPFPIVEPFFRRTIILIILAVIYLVGLMLANAARSNSKKARSYESDNGVQKAGNIHGVIGTIINSIAIAVILIVLFVSILNYMLILY